MHATWDPWHCKQQHTDEHTTKRDKRSDSPCEETAQCVCCNWGPLVVVLGLLRLLMTRWPAKMTQLLNLNRSRPTCHHSPSPATTRTHTSTPTCNTHTHTQQAHASLGREGSLVTVEDPVWHGFCFCLTARQNDQYTRQGRKMNDETRR